MKRKNTGKNDLIKMCDELNACKKRNICNSGNEILCAKRKIKKYVQNDFDNYLKLKALAQRQYLSDKVNTSEVSIVVSVTTILVNICLKLYEGISKQKIIEILVVVLIVLAMYFFLDVILKYRYEYRKSWMNYLRVAIAEEEKRYRRELLTADEKS